MLIILITRKNNRSEAKYHPKDMSLLIELLLLLFFFCGDDMVSTRSIQKEVKDSKNWQLLIMFPCNQTENYRAR